MISYFSPAALIVQTMSFEVRVNSCPKLPRRISFEYAGDDAKAIIQRAWALMFMMASFFRSVLEYRGEGPWPVTSAQHASSAPSGQQLWRISAFGGVLVALAGAWCGQVGWRGRKGPGWPVQGLIGGISPWRHWLTAHGHSLRIS